MATIKDIEEIRNSRQPLIWINTFEERRVIDEIISSSIVGLVKPAGSDDYIIDPRKKFYIWSCTQGLVEIRGKEFASGFDTLKPGTNDTLQPTAAIDIFANERLQKESFDGAVLVMRDIHKLMTIPMPVRKMKDLIKHLSVSQKAIFLVGPSNEIPEELQKDVYYVDFEYPDATVIESTLRSLLDGIRSQIRVDKKDERYCIAKVKNKTDEVRYKVVYTNEEVAAIVKSAQGLTKSEITFAFAKSLNSTPNGEILYEKVAEEKRNIIKRSQVLEFWTKTESLSDVGGNGELKKWLVERSHAISGKAIAFGASTPKGILLVGVPGCGKSMLAKAVPDVLKIPLVRLDMGRVFAGLVGSSERNMRNMTIQAEAMAPDVLWIDEVEKGLSGTGSSNFSDGGTTSRVFGTFTTWMQEKTKQVFVVATANDLSQLNAEVLRKGRFDKIWFVDLPTIEERDEIFRIHLARKHRDPKIFDVSKLSEQQYRRNDEVYDYSGAEIEEAINDAIYSRYSRLIMKKIPADDIKIGSEHDITTGDIITALETTVPLSCTAQDKIAKVRKWGQKHAQFASSNAAKLAQVGTTRSDSNTKISSEDLGLTSGL